MSSRPQGSYMFLKYTNALMRTSIFALLQSRSCLGGSLLWVLSLKAKFQCSPSTTGMAHHSLIYAVQHTHTTVTQSIRRNSSTYSSYFSKKANPHLSFPCLCFGSIVFSLLPISFGGWPSLSTVILMIIFPLRWLFV